MQPPVMCKEIVKSIIRGRTCFFFLLVLTKCDYKGNYCSQTGSALKVISLLTSLAGTDLSAL